MIAQVRGLRATIGLVLLHSATPAAAMSTMAAAFAARARAGSRRTSAAEMAPSINIASCVAKPSASVAFNRYRAMAMYGVPVIGN
jgi:hypothetical protein